MAMPPFRILSYWTGDRSELLVVASKHSMLKVSAAEIHFDGPPGCSILPIEQVATDGQPCKCQGEQ
jgi:hypothetical protein